MGGLPPGEGGGSSVERAPPSLLGAERSGARLAPRNEGSPRNYQEVLRITTNYSELLRFPRILLGLLRSSYSVFPGFEVYVHTRIPIQDPNRKPNQAIGEILEVL